MSSPKRMAPPMALAVASLLAPAASWATNGYFAHGYSISQSAMGGAGTAMAEDALAASINPAAINWVGNRMDFGISIFHPNRGYEAGDVGPGAQNSIMRIETGGVRSANKFFYIPGFGYTHAINDRLSWGLAMYGNGGMNTEYHGNTAHFGEGFGIPPLLNLETQCHGSFGGGTPVNGASDTAGFCGNVDEGASVNMIQLFVQPSLSYKLGELTSLGISPIFAAQRFRADGLMAFAKFSNEPDKVSDNGYDQSYGYGARIGFLTGIVPGIGIGGSYRTRMQMTRFKEYAGLFAGGGEFDIPSSWNIGISARLGEDLRLAFDMQRINYSEVKSVGNRLEPNDFVNNCAKPRLFAALGLGGSTDPSPACLGAETGPGFGWQDMTVYKAGVQYRFADFKFRLGYSQTDQPIPSSEVLFNVLAPGVMEKHYTAGVSYRFSQKLSFDFAGMYAPTKKVRGKNPLSNTDATTTDLIGLGQSTANAFGPDANDQDITLDMRQWQFSVGVGLSF